ncbi:Sphingomyelin phosphodiesterase [Balamuthia mandrillaris]
MTSSGRFHHVHQDGGLAQEGVPLLRSGLQEEDLPSSLSASDLEDSASTAAHRRRALPQQQQQQQRQGSKKRTCKVIVGASVMALVFIIALGGVALTLSFFLTSTHGKHEAEQLGYFLHISDIHYDPLYDANYNATHWCREPTYRLMNPTANNISSAATDANERYSFGRYGCDPPFKLVLSALEGMVAVHHSPDFVLITGDNNGHYLPKEQLAKETLTNVTNAIMKAFPNTTVLPVLGNNDLWPDYYIPYGPSDWMDWLTSLWSPWLNEEQQKTFRNGGYYSADIKGGKLKVIALNSILYSVEHIPNITATISEPSPLRKLPEDPNQQFQWLSDQLALARSNQQAYLSSRHSLLFFSLTRLLYYYFWFVHTFVIYCRVYIAGHIPYGVNEYDDKPAWYQPYEDRYLSLVTEYADVIRNQLFAHYHTDNFRVNIAAKNATPPQPSISLMSSISPAHFNNPSFRLYSYSRSSSQIVDYIHYYADLHDANILKKAEWVPEYRFREAYNATAVTTENYLQIYDTFHLNSKSYRQYMNYLYTNYQIFRSETYCAIGHLSVEDYSKCLKENADDLLAINRVETLAERKRFIAQRKRMLRELMA